MKSHTHELLEQLRGNNGAVIAEIHTATATCQLLIDSMQALKAQGVKRIYMENYSQDSSDSLEVAALRLDMVRHSRGKIAPEFRPYMAQLAVVRECYGNNADELAKIKAHFDDQISAIKELYPQLKALSDNDIFEYIEQITQNALDRLKEEEFSQSKLIKIAAQNGIQIIPIDQKAIKRNLSKEDRLEKFNANAEGKVQSDQATTSGEKYLIVSGLAHAHTVLGVKGLGERLGIPIVDVYDGNEKNHGIVRNVKYTDTLTEETGIEFTTQLLIQFNNKPGSSDTDLHFTSIDRLTSLESKDRQYIAEKKSPSIESVSFNTMQGEFSSTALAERSSDQAFMALQNVHNASLKSKFSFDKGKKSWEIEHKSEPQSLPTIITCEEDKCLKVKNLDPTDKLAIDVYVKSIIAFAEGRIDKNKLSIWVDHLPVDLAIALSEAAIVNGIKTNCSLNELKQASSAANVGCSYSLGDGRVQVEHQNRSQRFLAEVHTALGSTPVKTDISNVEDTTNASPTKSSKGGHQPEKRKNVFK